MVFVTYTLSGFSLLHLPCWFMAVSWIFGKEKTVACVHARKRQVVDYADWSAKYLPLSSVTVSGVGQKWLCLSLAQVAVQPDACMQQH